MALRHHSRTVILPHVLAHLKALNQRAHHVWVRQPAGVAAGVATTAAPAVASLPEVSLAAANAAVAAMTPVQRGWLASLQSGVPPSAETLTAMMSAVASAAGLSIPQAALPATGPVQTGLPGLMRTSGAPSASGAPAASQTAQLGTPAGLWAHAVASGGAHRGAADPPRAGPLVRAGGGGASAPRGLPGLTVAPSSAATSATPAAGRQPPRLPNPMHQPPRGPNAATRPLPPALRPPAAAGVNGGGGIRPGGAIAAAPLADRGRPLQTATPASAPPATAAATGLTPALASAVLGGASEAAGAPVAVAADAAVPQSMAGQKRPASTLAELPASGGAGVESVARVLIPGGGEAGDAGAASHKRRSPRSGDADADDAAAALVSAVGPAPLLSDASWPTVSTAVGVGSRISSAVPRGWQQQAQSKAGSSGSGLPGVGTGAPAPQSASSTLVPRAWSSSAATRGPGAK